MYIRYGFMETPDVPAVLRKIKLDDKEINPEECSFFLGREKVLAAAAPGMAVWREHLFAWMTQNATGAPYYFNLPAQSGRGTRRHHRVITPRLVPRFL